MMVKRAFVVFVVWIAFCSQGVAQDLLSTARLLDDEKGPWQITAKSLTFKEKEGAYIAEGDVVISRGDQFLFADKAVYNVKAETAAVSGNVRLEVGGDILVGERGEFDLKNQTGKVMGGCIFLRENNFYIGGDSMEKVGKDTYVIKNCVVTTCDALISPWTITGSEVKVTVEGYGKVKHAAFRIRRIPFLYVPYMIFPAKTKRQSGLLPPGFGYSSRNGMDVELPFFWAITDWMDATFYQRVLSRRGYMQGLEFRYKVGKNSDGIFMFDILYDNKEKDMDDPDDLDITPFPRTNDTRYWLRGKADQDLPFGLVARVDADYVSDQDYLREFDKKRTGYRARPDLVNESGRPLEDRKSPTRRSALRLSRGWDDFSIQALTSYHQRPEKPRNDPTPQPLAGLNFMALPARVMGLPIVVSLSSDYDYIWRDTGVKGHRFALTPEMRFPIWLGPYVEFEPSFGYTLNTQWYEDDHGRSDHQYRGAYDARARIMTNIERTYEVNFARAKRLKHRIWPELSYRYRGPHDDDRDKRPWFEEFDAIDKINRVTFSLSNFLDARLEDSKGNVRYRQWATLDVSQSFDIDEARRDEHRWRTREPFRPLSADLVIRAFGDLDVRAGVRWDHYLGSVPDANMSLDFSMDRAGNRKDRYRVDYVYVKDGRRRDIQDPDLFWTVQSNVEHMLNFEVDVNLLYGFYVGSALERDLGAGTTLSNRYWLGYNSQCWGARLVVDFEDDETTVMVGFTLLGLGKISDVDLISY